MLTVHGDSCLPTASQLLIDGQYVDAKSGKTFEDLDPRTGAQGHPLHWTAQHCPAGQH